MKSQLCCMAFILVVMDLYTSAAFLATYASSFTKSLNTCHCVMCTDHCIVELAYILYCPFVTCTLLGIYFPVPTDQSPTFATCI